MPPEIAPVLVWTREDLLVRDFRLRTPDGSVLLELTCENALGLRYRLRAPDREWLLRTKGILGLRFEAQDANGLLQAEIRPKAFAIRKVGTMKGSSEEHYHLLFTRGFSSQLVVVDSDGNGLFRLERRFTVERFRLQTHVSFMPASRGIPQILLFVGLCYLYFLRLNSSK